MRRTTVRNLFDKKPIGEDILVKGWVKSLRKSKTFCFIVLNDGSAQKDLQIIADESLAGYEDFTKC